MWLSRVMDAWSEADPRAAVDWLLTREPADVASLTGPAFGALAKVNLAEAESLVAALPEGTARFEAQLSVFAVVLDEYHLDRAVAAFRDWTRAASSALHWAWAAVWHARTPNRPSHGRWSWTSQFGQTPFRFSWAASRN